MALKGQGRVILPRTQRESQNHHGMALIVTIPHHVIWQFSYVHLSLPVFLQHGLFGVIERQCLVPFLPHADQHDAHLVNVSLNRRLDGFSPDARISLGFQAQDLFCTQGSFRQNIHDTAQN